MSGPAIIGAVRRADAKAAEARARWRRLAACGDLVLVASGLPDRLSATEAAATDFRAFLPLRPTGATEDAGAWLRTNADAIGTALDRLDGCVEFVATKTLPPPTATAPDRAASGAGWLAAQAARRRAGAAALTELEREAETLRASAAARLRDSAIATFIAPRPGVDLCLLTPRDAASDIARRIHAAAPPDWRLSGPWPAHSFAGRYLAA